MDLLVAKLQKANWAYHNTIHPIMTDAEYDRDLEKLRKEMPTHPFLSVIGCAPAKGVLLPAIMGSQDKIKPDHVDRWVKGKGKEFLVSDKLDGLSALLVIRNGIRRLYLRGDGVKGVDITRAADRAIQGTHLSHRTRAPPKDAILRGELLLTKEDTPEGSIGRSIVNGWMHRANDLYAEIPDITKVRFVAYQVIEPAGLTRSEQLSWLTEHGMEVPWFKKVNPTEDALKTLLLERKSESKYPIDGLVVGVDAVPVGLGGGEARNPPDSVAFKMSLDEQKAEARVVDVVWTASRQGIWIPRIQIEQVEIGGAKIQWLSGHNAGFIVDNGIGIGASIIVRRSGDVIPALDEVLERREPKMPPADHWVWDDNKIQAKATDEVSPEKVLLHALQTLEVDGVGPGIVSKMVEGGFDTMVKLWKADVKLLGEAIGHGRAPAILKSLKERRAAAGWSTLLVASNRLPRGVGERKMRSLFEKEADPKKWMSASMDVSGWSDDTLKELWRVLPKAIAWVETSFPAAVAPVAPVAPVTSKRVVFTGVRDKELEKKIAGTWEIQDTVTKKTDVLVVADDFKESGKTKKATELGIRIMKISEFRTTY